MPRPTRILTWLMLVMLVGGHWGMLQVVAWTGMLIDYSQDNRFATAVGMTFAGDHPCAICQTVDQGIATDLGSDDHKTPGKLHKTIKLDAVVMTVVVSIPATAATIMSWTRRHDVSTSIDLESPRRPPRVMG